MGAVGQPAPPSKNRSAPEGLGWYWSAVDRGTSAGRVIYVGAPSWRRTYVAVPLAKSHQIVLQLGASISPRVGSTASVRVSRGGAADYDGTSAHLLLRVVDLAIGVCRPASGSSQQGASCLARFPTGPFRLDSSLVSPRRRSWARHSCQHAVGRARQHQRRSPPCHPCCRVTQPRSPPRQRAEQ